MTSIDNNIYSLLFALIGFMCWLLAMTKITFASISNDDKKILLFATTLIVTIPTLIVLLIGIKWGSLIFTIANAFFYLTLIRKLKTSTNK